MLFEKLTDKDKMIIESYIDRYTINCGSVARRSRAPLSTLLAEWDIAKSEYLYKLFGEKFILEKEIEYTEPKAALETKITIACRAGNVMYDFYAIYRKWYDTLSFSCYSKESEVLWYLICPSVLVGEKMGDDRYVATKLPLEINFDDNHKIKVETNTKPMRLLGKIVKMFNLDAEAFESFRLEHSRILNTKKLTGKLCLSIHPMDYMTMSMNKEKWTSCMNWSEPGGYRGGTVEVMNSNSTIVAYLKSDNNVLEWDDAPNSWNSKKWRILITMNDEHILAIKSYPYHNEELIKTCLEWMRHLAGKNLNTYMGSIIEVPYASTFKCEDNGQYYNIDMEDETAMYCDWGCATHYGCFNLYSTYEESSEEKPHRIIHKYCGERTCMICGSANEYYYDESYVACEDCCSNADDESYYCEECGNYVSEEDAIFIDGHAYCEDCIDRVADRCIIDGQYYHYRNLCQIFLARETDNPNIKTDKWIYMHEDYATARYPWLEIPERFTELNVPRKTSYGIYYFNKEDLTEYALDEWYNLFGDKEVAEYFAASEEN